VSNIISIEDRRVVDPTPAEKMKGLNDIICVRKVICNECNGEGCDACDNDGYTSYEPVEGWKAASPKILKALNGIMFAQEFPRLPFLTYVPTVREWLKK